MSDRMNLPRFETIVAAYGAAPDRWPEEERAAAMAFAAGDPVAARLLAEADGIDAMLFAHRVGAPSSLLRARIVDAAPRRRARMTRARLWWTSLACALAAGGGVLAGSAATAALVAPVAEVAIYDHDDVTKYDDARTDAKP